LETADQPAHPPLHHEETIMIAEPSLLDPATVYARIRELLNEFYSRDDHGESVVDLLEEEAQFVTPLRKAQGRDAVAALLQSLAQSREKKGGVGRHFGAKVNVENLGSGKFRVRSVMIFLSLDSGPGAQGFMNVGDHDDIVAFDSRGACRFVKRTMTSAARFTLSPLGN